MSRIGVWTDNGWIKGIWSVLKRVVFKYDDSYFKTKDEYKLNLWLYKTFYNYEQFKLK